MAAFGSVRYKRKPKLMPDGWADLRTANQNIYMMEERYFPATSITTNLMSVAGQTGAGTTAGTATAAELAVINAIINARHCRGFTFASADKTTTGSVATCTISGIDQFGVAKSETLTTVDTDSETLIFSWHAYQKITSIVIANSHVDGTVGHALVRVRFSEFLGLGCKIDHQDQMGIITYTTPGTVTTATVQKGTGSKVFNDCVIGTRVIGDGTKYCFYCGSGVAYSATSSYKMIVPCLNDQPENLQVTP